MMNGGNGCGPKKKEDTEHVRTAIQRSLRAMEEAKNTQRQRKTDDEKERREESGKDGVNINEKKPLTHRSNKIAAESTDIALQNTQNTNSHSHGVKGSAEGIEHESISKGSSEVESAEVVEDTTARFEALEKPEMLDLKAETASVKRKVGQMKKTDKIKQKTEKNILTCEALVDKTDFDKIEKPEEISKSEQMELERKGIRITKGAKVTVPKESQKPTSKKESLLPSATRSRKGEKSDKSIGKLTGVASQIAKSLRSLKGAKKQIGSSTRATTVTHSLREKSSAKAEVYKLDVSQTQRSMKSTRSQKGDKSLRLDVSQKSERRSSAEASQKSSRSMRERIEKALQKTQASLRPKPRKRTVDVMRTQDETEEEKKPQLPSQPSVLRAVQSIKDTFMDFSAYPEPGAQKSNSVPAISFYRRSSDPPVCHYKFVTVRVQTIDDLELTITENLVVLFIPSSSPAFYDLVIGDQIVECDGVVPRSLQEFNDYITVAEKVTLGIVRAWNVHPPSPKRMNNVLPHRKYCYLIVDLPLLTGLRPGYEFRCGNGRLYLAKLEPQTMGAFAFLAVDRIIDVDSDKIPPRVNMVALRNRIRAVQERDGFCTFLVERPSSLHHVTNPSCAAMKPEGIPADGIIMGDDAIEIGAREAFKYARVKNKLRFKPVYTMKSPLQQAIELDLITAIEDSEAASRRRRKRRRRLRIGKNPREKPIPSDVRRGTALCKASDNTIRKLVTKFISKTFSY